MTVDLLVAWQYTKKVASVLGYAALAAYMLFLGVMTYRYGGGFADTKAVVAIATLLLMFSLIVIVGFGNPLDRLWGST